MSNRLRQVESELQKALSQVFVRKLSDPRIEGLVSITKVQVSPDMHDAYVFISVLPEKHQKKTLYGLRHAAAYIHRLVRDEVAFKTVPHLDFRLDPTLKKEAEVFEAIRRANARTRPLPEGENEGEPAASTDESGNGGVGDGPVQDDAPDNVRGASSQENAS